MSSLQVFYINLCKNSEIAHWQEIFITKLLL